MRTSLFIFFMVIFIGCSENNIIDEGEKPEDPQAEIEVYYDQESTSSRKPDAGAKVYLYYDINITTAFGGLASYEGNGNYSSHAREHPESIGQIENSTRKPPRKDCPLIKLHRAI